MRQRLLRVLAAVAVLASTCTPTYSAAAPDAPATVTIAYQPGLSYATLIVMKADRILEKQFPQTKVDWKVLASGAAIRDGIVSGQVQIGSGGAGPFLVGWDRGVGYKLLGSLNEISLWLVARDPKLKTLKDFGANAKVGLPAPDAIQAIVLRKAAQEQLGNAHALDANMVSIEHPLGVVALQSGQLDAHLASPPFQEQEVAAGAHVILRSYDVFGKSTFNAVYTTDAFANRYPAFVQTFYRDLVDTTAFVNKNPDKVAEDLSQDAQGKVTPAQFKAWLSGPDITFETVPHGFMKYAVFMHQIGLLSKAPASIKDIELPILRGAGD